MKRVIRWVAINGSVAALLAYALVDGSEGAARLFVFFSWFSAVITTLAALSDETKEKCREKGLSVPIKVGILYDMAMLCTLAWHGWWFTVIAWVLILCAYCSLYAEEDES